MNSPTSKWNARYAFSGQGIPPPARVLSQGLRWLPDAAGTKTDACDSTNAGRAVEQLTALDLACGRAGNGHLLAQRGFHVSAWDISDNVIEQIRARKPPLIANAVVRDVTAQPPQAETFDVIVVSRFLERDICADIAAALKPNGVLFYQTFVHGLSNPDYLLAPDELLSLFKELDVLEYYEPAKDTNGKAEAHMIAKRNP